MNWIRIAFDDSKSHAVPRDLAPALIVDMLDRGMPIMDFEARYGRANAAAMGGNPDTIRRWMIDFGGSCYANEPRETLELDGLAITVPCFHWAQAAAEVARLSLRTFVGGERYYKLHHWHHATVMTPVQQRLLLSSLARGRARALELAREFNAARQREHAERRAQERAS